MDPAPNKLLLRRLEREKRARIEAERILENKAIELFVANQALEKNAAELRHQNELAEQAARTDELTRLPNRRGFFRELDSLMQEVLRDPESRLVLGKIDLDHFKKVNDRFGHITADLVLTQFSDHFSNCFDGGVLGRVGGDEFAVALIVVKGGGDRQAIAEKMLRATRATCHAAGATFELTASVGLVEAGPGDLDIDKLRRLADIALYTSKRKGRNRCIWFDEAMRTGMLRQSLLEDNIREAVEADLFEPWFQPIVGCAKHELLSAEVLSRWPEGTMPNASVEEVIRLSERIGSIEQLDAQVQAKAFRKARDWVRAGNVQSISVNVTPRDMLDDQFLPKLAKRLRAADFPPDHLTVEITENALFADMNAAAAGIGNLSALGIKVALDDFGVGYSNLRALSELPIHYLKMDRSLIRDIAQEGRARALAESAVRLGVSLGLCVVAEGVETKDQALLLRRFGCHRLQGYMFGKAVSAAKFNDAFSGPSKESVA